MVTACLLALALQDEKAVDDALEAFKAAIKAASEAERATAVADLARVRHPRTLARLTPYLSTDGPTVRLAAAKGLSEFADQRKAASAALVAALPANAKLPDVQAGILEAVGLLKDPSALAALHKSFDEKDARPAKAAVVGAALQRSPSTIEPLLELLRKLDRALKEEAGAAVTAPAAPGYDLQVRDDAERKRAQDLKPAVLKALQDLTGETFANAVDAQAWWARHKAGFRPK
jgi:HEAT repeat protein